MVVVPGKPAVTIPVVRPIVATVVLPLLHVPPAVASDKVMDEPAHTLADPVIMEDDGLTVTVVNTVQPEPRE